MGFGFEPHGAHWIDAGRPGGSDPVKAWSARAAVLHTWSRDGDTLFPLTIETKRIAPGQKNTWELTAIGMSGGVRFSTKNLKLVEVFDITDVAGIGREQTWRRIDAGSRSVWPTVTGADFESGFSDSILQMWAAFLAEREGLLGPRFGTVRPEEAAVTHRSYQAAIRSQETQSIVAL